MEKVKQTEIKNRTYYFYNDIINIEESNSSKKPYKDINIQYIRYITTKKVGDFENIDSVNPLYLMIGEVVGHIEENNENKDENKEVLRKQTELWDGIKNEIETINDGKKSDYDKDFLKMKFNTDDNLLLNKLLKLKFHLLTIIVTCIFEDDGKFTLQLYLDNCLYEVQMLEYDRIDISEGIDVNRTSASKRCDICHYWYFKDIGFKYEPYLCNGCHDLTQKAMSFSDVAFILKEVLRGFTLGI